MISDITKAIGFKDFSFMLGIHNKIIKGLTLLPLQDNVHMLRHPMQHFQAASS
jgi:hypothetical protein